MFDFCSVYNISWSIDTACAIGNLYYRGGSSIYSSQISFGKKNALVQGVSPREANVFFRRQTKIDAVLENSTALILPDAIDRS